MNKLTVNRFREAVRGHEGIFADSDSDYVNILWRDIPEFCEVMDKLCENPLDFCALHSVKHYYNFLIKYGDTISDNMYLAVDAELDASLNTLTAIVRRFL